MRRALVAAGVAAVLTVAGATVAVAAGETVPVGCTITDNVLTCPLPEQVPSTVTVTEVPGAETVTVTADPVTETATVTETPAPVTVTAPPVTETATVTATVTAQPTTASPTPTSTSTSTSTTTPVPPATGFPTAATTGTPAGWQPANSYTGDRRITVAGTVVQDMRITNGDLVIDAANVTVRRVEIIGGQINNFPGSTCRKGLVIEDSTIKRGTTTRATDPEAIGPGGYTARNVELDGVPEGFRVGGKASCGGVTLENSYAKIVRPDVCGDWHGDGVQGYDGGALIVRNVSIELVETGCGGTAPFFVPSGQGNTSVDIDGLMVKGGGYSFRSGMPGPVRNLNIVRGSWGYGPVDVRCAVVTVWDAYVVDVDSNGQPVNRAPRTCAGVGN